MNLKRVSMNGGVGVLIAVWATGVIRGLVPPALDALTFSAIRPDRRMLLFAVVTAAVSRLASGMIPALHATRQDLAKVMPIRNPVKLPGP